MSENTEITNDESLDTGIDYSDDEQAASALEDYLDDDGYIASKDPEPEPSPAAPEAPAAPTLADDSLVTIKVDGVEKQVPLSELKNGYQRQADYTQKTQQLSQERQQVQAQQEQYNQYLTSIPMLAQVATSNIQTAQAQLYSPEMAQLAQTDPSAYVAKRAELESSIVENQQAFQQMQQQFQAHKQEQEAAYEQQFIQMKQQADQILTREIPNWTEPAVKKAILDYGLSTGFSGDEMNNVIDPRMIATLNKARLYDELVRNQGNVSKKVQAAPPKVLSGGAHQESDQRADFAKRSKQVLKSGNDRDIAALMAELL